MKFTAVVVVLALALGIEASTVAWGPSLHGGPAAWGHGGPAAWGHGGAWDGRALSGAWGGHDDWSGHGDWDNGAWDNGHWDNGHWDNGHWDNGAWDGHAHGAWAPAVAVATHAAYAPAHGAWGHGHEGSYVAKTRGAVHVAPLAGHANSAASINLQPAPGTV